MRIAVKITRFVLPVILLAIIGSFAPARQNTTKNTKYPQQVLIIRHAEKTGEKDDTHLSKRGRERAEELYKLFTFSKDRPEPLPKPDFIFAASNSQSSHRPLETVTPLARKLKQEVNDGFDSKIPAAKEGTDAKALRDILFGDPKYFGKTVLISWRHSTIVELAKAFKAKKVPEKWEDDVFDRVWQITYDDAGNAKFFDRPQKLLPKDSGK